MEAKYYTPHLSEFYVGFEYEELNILSVYDDHWKVKVKKEVFTQELWRSGYSNWNFLDKLQEGKIRVKYLDKEDIESLGFVPCEYKGTIGYKKNRTIIYFFSFPERSPYVSIDIEDTQYFRGSINNKSELKKVLQMLGIE